jgi:hypothetical protein
MELQPQSPSIKEATSSLAFKLNRDIAFARDTLPSIDTIIECIDCEYSEPPNENTQTKQLKAMALYEIAHERKALLKSIQTLYNDLDVSPEALCLEPDNLRLMQMFVKMQSENINYESSDLASNLLQLLNEYESYSLSNRSHKFRSIIILEKLHPIFKILQTQKQELSELVLKYQTLLEPTHFSFPKLLKKYSTPEAMNKFDELIGLSIQVSTNTTLESDNPNSLYKLFISPLNFLARSLMRTRDMIANNYAIADNAFGLDSLYVSLNQLEKIFAKMNDCQQSSEIFLLTDLSQFRPNEVHHSQIFFIRSQAYEGIKTPYETKKIKLKKLEQKLAYLRNSILDLMLNNNTKNLTPELLLYLDQALIDYDKTMKHRKNAQRLTKLKNQQAGN